MSKIYLGIGLALVLAIPAAASAAVVPVTSLSGDFAATNSTVTLTADGVHFGTYADGGVLGGSLVYSGFDGHTLGELTDFSYTFTYRQAGDTTGAAPYARVFLDADDDGIVDNDIILDPSFCATTTPDQATELTYQMVGNSVRFNEDSCDGVPPDNQPWATAIAGHEDETIVGLLVSQGFSTGTDVSALVPRITVNGTTFEFGAPVAGPPGGTGATGAPGVAGTAGTTTTVVVQQAASTVRLIGAQLRIIHVQKRKGEKFLSARATLRGKSLKVRGRAIQVDLRNKPAGNYNVHIVAKYRTKSGKVHIVRSTRNLSVTVA